jgi:hypothetical protein
MIAAAMRVIVFMMIVAAIMIMFIVTVTFTLLGDGDRRLCIRVAQWCLCQFAQLAPRADLTMAAMMCRYGLLVTWAKVFVIRHEKLLGGAG